MKLNELDELVSSFLLSAVIFTPLLTEWFIEMSPPPHTHTTSVEAFLLQLEGLPLILILILDIKP